MSSWLQEIGEKRFTPKEIILVSRIFKLMAEADEEIDQELLVDMIEKLDNAIHNVTELKKSMEELTNGRN